MTPLEYYRKQLASNEILPDERQLIVVQKLENIYQQLVAKQEDSGFTFKSLFQKPEIIKGLYLWGSVGVGKTFLMNTFYFCLPFDNKLRIHFYAFMQKIHQQLAQLKGKSDPLKLIAEDLAKKYAVICFDELFVSEIGDAMLLAGLFENLFQRNVCLIITSNTHPEDLYKNGLQRARFIPAIKLIQQYMEVVNLDITKDYRQDHPSRRCGASPQDEREKFYLTPNDVTAQLQMERYFSHYSQNAPLTTEPLLVHGRAIKIIKQADGVVWFDFMSLCGIPRSPDDYLFIAEHFSTVLLSDVQVFGKGSRDLALSFIKVIDVFYDSKIRLIISAAKPISELYQEQRFAFEFKRTASRLTEMQSISWR